MSILLMPHNENHLAYFMSMQIKEAMKWRLHAERCQAHSVAGVAEHGSLGSGALCYQHH